DPNLIFMLVGRDNTTDNNELMDWLREHHLINNFRLLGQRDDIPHCLKAMDIFCLHSKTEGFPNVLGEAMALGVTAIVRDVGDSKYLIQRNLFIQNEVDGYCRTILAVLDDRSLLVEEGKKNIDIIRKFSMDEYIKRVN